MEINMSRKHVREFPFFRRNLLKLVHKLQIIALKMENTNLYYLLAKIHFKIWFKMTLTKCMVDMRPEAKLAMRRHARIVMKHVFVHLEDRPSRRTIAKWAMKTFYKNILLDCRL